MYSDPVETTDLPILILSLQPFPPSQCWVRTWVMDCLQAMHALSIAKGCSLQQCPQIILVARSISWSPSFSSWQISQGQHLPQQGNLGKTTKFLCQRVEFGLYDPNVLNSDFYFYTAMPQLTHLNQRQLFLQCLHVPSAGKGRPNWISGSFIFFFGFSTGTLCKPLSPENLTQIVSYSIFFLEAQSINLIFFS